MWIVDSGGYISLFRRGDGFPPYVYAGRGLNIRGTEVRIVDGMEEMKILRSFEVLEILG